jgi:hypothetical protein
VRISRLLLLLAVQLLVCSPAFAQTADFTDWVYQRLALVTAAAAGPVSPSKQVETPSLAGTSTAIVDSAGAPDLIGISTQFFNASRSGDSDRTPSSLTLSAFALRSALVGTDAMRPEVYASGRNWRRLSLSVGRLAEDADAGQPAGQLVGVKVLALDQRDPSRPATVARLQESLRTSATGQGVALAFDALFELIAMRLGPRLGETDPDAFAVTFLGKDTHAKTMEQLTDEDLAAIDRLLVEQLSPAMQAAVTEQRAVLRQLRQAPQLAFSYQASLREDAGDDEHLVQGIFEYGVVPRVNLAVNAGVSRILSELVGDDTVVRVSGHAQVRLTGEDSRVASLLRAQAPLMLTASFSGGWHRESDDIYKGQVKLTVPMPGRLGGVSLPISVTFANRTELIDEREVRGQVGFTLDFAALQQGLRGGTR